MEKWTIELLVYGRNALFTEPYSKSSGEKTTMHIPSYDALKGVLESIYFKPSIYWIVESVRVLKPIITSAKGMTPLNYEGGNRKLSYYTYLEDVAYQVKARIELNRLRTDLQNDFNLPKHHQIALRSLEKGGRRDVYLGVRECQAYVEPCEYGSGNGYYDNSGTMDFGVMVHGLNYPDKTLRPTLETRLWNAQMVNGEIHFPLPSECTIIRKIKDMPIEAGCSQYRTEGARENVTL